MNQAVFWVTPKSRCSFMDETPLRLVISRQIAKTHLRRDILDLSSAVPIFTENARLQDGQ